MVDADAHGRDNPAMARGSHGRYQLGARLGGGGMAEVFRAKQLGAERFSKDVAIKRMHPTLSADPQFAAMFIQEAHVVARLTHPNIVQVLDFDRDREGRLFLVMELVEGPDLFRLAKTGQIPVSVATFIVVELLRALAFAHTRMHQGEPLSVVHRDISPQNVLISWDGTVKLSDFGIAKATQSVRMTQPGTIKGKPEYLSPEQAQGARLDGRSDLFAVGIVAYELLTGEPLFGVAQGTSDAVIVNRVLNHPIPSLRAKNPQVSVELEKVCLKLLSRELNRRYVSASDALQAIFQCPDVPRHGQLQLSRLMAARFAETTPDPPSTLPKLGPADASHPSNDKAKIPSTKSKAAPFTNPQAPLQTGESVSLLQAPIFSVRKKVAWAIAGVCVVLCVLSALRLARTDPTSDVKHRASNSDNGRAPKHDPHVVSPLEKEKNRLGPDVVIGPQPQTIDPIPIPEPKPSSPRDDEPKKDPGQKPSVPGNPVVNRRYPKRPKVKGARQKKQSLRKHSWMASPWDRTKK